MLILELSSMIDTKELRKIANKATRDWVVGKGNVPFYVDVQKPAPSMSKHDDERPTYWKYDDGVFVCCFSPAHILELLDEIDRLKEIELQYNDVG